MDFTNNFTVNAPLDQVWATLTNAREVAPCVPGAEITEMIDDQHFKGLVKVKLGAVQMSYRGEMEMQPEEAAHTIVLSGRGTDTRGGGGASGKVTVHLTEEGDGTAVRIDSQVDVTGRVATFGRSLLPDVAARLTREFAACMQNKLSGPGEGEAAGSAAGTPIGGRAPAQPPPSPSGEEGSSAVEAPGSAIGRVAAAQPTTSSQSNSVDVMALLGDVLRTRAATLLRDLANLIEPR